MNGDSFSGHKGSIALFLTSGVGMDEAELISADHVVQWSGTPVGSHYYLIRSAHRRRKNLPNPAQKSSLTEEE